MKNLFSLVVTVCLAAMITGCGSKDEASDLGADVAPELGSGSSDPSAFFDMGDPADSSDADADEATDNVETDQPDTTTETDASEDDSSSATTPEETHVLEDDPAGN